jgi:DNA-binding NarL/FixJ family response regulator
MSEEPEHQGSSIGVVTVDDHEAFRRSAREVVENTPGFTFLGEASSGEEALVLIKDLSPDLVLLDVRMPGLDGLETSRRLRSMSPAATVILISIDDVAESVWGSCGAAAFLPKKAFNRAALRQLWNEHGARQTQGENA